MGGGVLLLPTMLVVYDTPTAIAMIAPLMLVNSLGKIWVFRRQLDLRVVLLLGVLGWPAALLGGFYVDQVDADILKVLIILLIAGMVGLERGLGRDLILRERALPGWGAITGLLAGLTGVSGPTMALALRGRGVEGAPFVAIAALVVCGIQVLRIPAYALRGVLTPAALPVLLLLSTVAVGAVLIGRSLLNRLSLARWRGALDLLLVGVGLFLAADVLGWIPR